LRNPFPLAAALILAATCPLRAAEKPRPAPATQNQANSPAKTKKVWTDEDMAGLRSRGLISIVGQEPGQAPASGQTAPAATEPSFPVYDSRLDDPVWYGAVAADLQAQLDQAEAELQQQQSALADAKDRITQPGVALYQPSLGVTPDGALGILQSRVQEIQSRLDELADLARQHDIPPGDLRS
jgi:hypothetical protein